MQKPLSYCTAGLITWRHLLALTYVIIKYLVLPIALIIAFFWLLLYLPTCDTNSVLGPTIGSVIKIYGC